VTSATAARALLRQDPDVVMIGEIRDTETALVAVQIALTGHLVLTQLHAATAPGALRRLIDIGVEPFLINQSVVGVLSQRLVRKLCTACRRPSVPDLSMLPPEAAPLVKDGQGSFYEPVGCEACRGTGLRGRKGSTSFWCRTTRSVPRWSRAIWGPSAGRPARQACGP